MTTDPEPQYTLEESIAVIDEWMNSPDANPPNDLIEIFQSARYWLEFLRDGNEVLAGSADAVGRISQLGRPKLGDGGNRPILIVPPGTFTQTVPIGGRPKKKAKRRKK